MRCENVDNAGGRLVSPSAERNKGPIADVLRLIVPAQGVVLEVSSGTGQHVVHFAREMPHLTWQPSERDEEALRSIQQWVATEALANVRAPLRLDVMEQPWPVSDADAVLCLNMIHIAPWPAGEALIRGASAILAPGGIFLLYGPFRRNGAHTAPSNEAFDRQLQSRDPQWGVRNLEDVAAYAAAHGFGAPEVCEMPANNLSVAFRKR
jgi:SAM-dependent methyltransferase